MELRHLELLRDLAHYGSITAVARATFRTPSAVSQQLKTAQRDFGTPLVEPYGRGLRLTDAGRLLAAGGADVAASVERVQARWDAYRGSLSGTVSILSLPSAATFLYADTLAALAGTDIHLTLTDLDLAEADWATKVADVDIVIGHSLTGPAPAGTDGLAVTTIAREPLDVALAVGHPLAAKGAFHAADLVDAEWIGVPRGYPFDTILQRIELATGQRLRVAQRLIDNRLVETLVIAGNQVAILPRFTTPARTGMVLRPLLDVEATRCISAIMRPDKAERRVVRHVVEVLQGVGAAVEARHLV